MSRTVDISPLSVLMSRVDQVADGAPVRDSIGSGFPSLDKALGGGLRRGDLLVLGGDVGSGKSALALAIALRAAASHRVVFLTDEMEPERVHERILGIEGRARVDDLRRGTLDDITRAAVGAAAIRLRDSLPVIDRLPHDVASIREVVAGGPQTDLLIVDCLQSLAQETRTLSEDLAVSVRGLKALALDARIAILTTAQLPNLGSRSDPRPALEDFGAEGAVKYHADVVLGLYREEMYHNAPHISGATELHIRKNRSGGTGYIDLFFFTQWLRFEDVLDRDR